MGRIVRRVLPEPVTLLLIASPFALVAFVLDTLRVADRRGGYPAVSLTYRAYGA